MGFKMEPIFVVLIWTLHVCTKAAPLPECCYQFYYCTTILWEKVVKFYVYNKR